jgi:dUTP pyrophosphatase
MKVKLLYEGAKAPVRKPSSVGYDLHAAVDGVIPPGATAVIPLGFALEFDESLGAFIWGRSGIATQGIHPLGIVVNEEHPENIRLAGCIEGSFRGEWKVVLFNSGKNEFPFKRGDRVAQFVLQPVVLEEIEEVTDLSESERGENGWGSTGR